MGGAEQPGSADGGAVGGLRGRHQLVGEHGADQRSKREQQAPADGQADAHVGDRPQALPGGDRDRQHETDARKQREHEHRQDQMFDTVAERAAQSVVFVFTCKDQAGWEEEHKDDKEKFSRKRKINHKRSRKHKRSHRLKNRFLKQVFLPMETALRKNQKHRRFMHQKSHS